jgi:hypothetical protein
MFKTEAGSEFWALQFFLLLDLFRISDFELRISATNTVVLQDAPAGRYAQGLALTMVGPFSIINSKCGSAVAATLSIHRLIWIRNL